MPSTFVKGSCFGTPLYTTCKSNEGGDKHPSLRKKGGAVKWRDSGGGAAPLYQLISGMGEMVWQYIIFPTLIKPNKGLLVTVIRIQGTAEARRCGAVAVRSQVITWSSTLTLYALHLPRPPPSPSYQLRPFFLRLGRLSPPSLLLHVVYRGVPNQLPLTKVLGIQLWKNLSNLLFLCRSAPVHFRNTLRRKMLSLLRLLINPKILIPIFLSMQFFTLPS